MKIILKTKHSPLNLFKKCGYTLIGQDETAKEFSLVKRISNNNYLRFHAYVKKEGELVYINLHLDEKKPSYPGYHAHNAQYQGEILEAEKQRIEKVLQSL